MNTKRIYPNGTEYTDDQLMHLYQHYENFHKPLKDPEISKEELFAQYDRDYDEVLLQKRYKNKYEKLIIVSYLIIDSDKVTLLHFAMYPIHILLHAGK